MYAYTTLQVEGEVLTAVKYLYFCTSKASKVSTSRPLPLQVGGEVMTAGDLRVRLEVLTLLALLVQKYKY